MPANAGRARVVRLERVPADPNARAARLGDLDAALAQQFDRGRRETGDEEPRLAVVPGRAQRLDERSEGGPIVILRCGKDQVASPVEWRVRHARDDSDAGRLGITGGASSARVAAR